MPKSCMILLLLICAHPCLARDKMNISFPNDSSFSCTLQVKLQEKPQKLYKHFSKRETSLKLIGSADTAFYQGDAIVAQFKAFNYRATSKTKLLTNPDSLQLTMVVTSFTHNWRVVPKVIKGHSHYRFSATETSTLFVYTQEVKTDRKLNGLHKFLIRWQLKPLAKQILKECKKF